MNLLASRKLNSYIADIDEQANEMFLRLVKEIAESEMLPNNSKQKMVCFG